MRGILILAGLGLIATAAYYVFANDIPIKLEADDSIPTQKDLRRPADMVGVETTGLASTPPAVHPDRIVGRDIIAVPDFEQEQLERLPPREALSQPIDRGEAGAPGTQLLYRPIALAAGIVEAQGYKIRIAGMVPVTPDTVCGEQAVIQRPCGRLALTAFRAWLRGRAIECDLQQPLADGMIEASCRLGGKDAASWLVENGWGHAKAGSKYQALEDTARQNRRGIFASNSKN